MRIRGINRAADNDGGANTSREETTGQSVTAQGASDDDAPLTRSEMQALRADTETFFEELSRSITQQLEQLQRRQDGVDDSASSESSGDTDSDNLSRHEGRSRRSSHRTSSSHSNRERREGQIVLSRKEFRKLLRSVSRPAATIQVNTPPTFDGKDRSEFQAW